MKNNLITNIIISIKNLLFWDIQVNFKKKNLKMHIEFPGQWYIFFVYSIMIQSTDHNVKLKWIYILVNLKPTYYAWKYSFG